MNYSNKTIYAQVNTKSNFYGTNEKFLEVVEFVGTIVVCKIPLGNNNLYNSKGETFVNADFNLKEIKRLVPVQK